MKFNWMLSYALIVCVVGAFSQSANAGDPGVDRLLAINSRWDLAADQRKAVIEARSLTQNQTCEAGAEGRDRYAWAYESLLNVRDTELARCPERVADIAPGNRRFCRSLEELLDKYGVCMARATAF